METIRSSISGATSYITGTTATSSQSGTEPPSGITGKGTADQPYDQGNAPEAVAGPGIEPVSGQTGAGTLTVPYDQGNQSENSNITITQPDSESSSATQTQPATASKTPTAYTGGSGLQASEITKVKDTAPDSGDYNLAKASNASNAKAQQPQTQLAPTEEGRGRALETSSGSRGAETELSPGQLDDGSHVATSGDKGESYEPANKLNKLKGKFHIGKH